MAVDFPSDLILDVARAADPASAGRAKARLSGAAAADFDGLVARANAGSHRISRTDPADKAQAVAKEFESLLVANMIKDMMGDEDESYFGGGFAGGVWKSMMADHMATAVVEAADFGVASKISKYFVRNGESIEPLTGINDAASTPVDTRAQDVARKGTNEISMDFIRKMMTPTDISGKG